MKFKTEPYITHFMRNGHWVFRVRYQGNEKNFSASDKVSPLDAQQKAIEYRDYVISQVDGVKEIRDVLIESFELIPIRDETKRKLLITYDRYIKLDKPLFDVTKQDIILSLNNMIGTCTNDLISRVLAIYRRIYKTAMFKDYVDKDLTIGIVPPKSLVIAKPKRKVTTTREELDSVIAQLNNKSIEMALEMMWYCGLRPAECFALRKDDIIDGYISVTKELGSGVSEGYMSGRTKPVVRQCKTEYSVREIPIPTELMQKLDKYKPKGSLLFPDKDGDYFDVQSVTNKIHRISKTFNMYQLRHTLATKLVTNNVDKRTIIEILGHENIDMSIYYARSNEDLKLKALE